MLNQHQLKLIDGSHEGIANEGTRRKLETNTLSTTLGTIVFK
jgi:hypothetical protein